MSTVTPDSEVGTITNDQINAAYTLLWQTSPDFRDMMKDIIEAGYTTTIISVDGTLVPDTNPDNLGATAYSRTDHSPSSTATTITISEQLLQTTNYKTSYSPESDSVITLERIIAHEMVHVWQAATSSTLSTGAQEEEAAEKENKIMASFHEAPRVGDPGSSYPHYDGSTAPVPSHPIFGYGPHTVPTGPGSVGDAETPWASAPLQTSPLVVDLSSGHTGVTLTTFDAATTTIFFDIAGTGFASQTAWTSGDTGFLVRDLNSNGVIDNINEMFGSPTVDGFAQLATLDSNHDLKIDASDSAWNSLQIWTDANGDGITEGGELHSLSSLGIKSIDLAGVASSTSTIDGNSVSHTSTVTFSDGSTSAIDDVWLTHSTVDTYYNTDYTIDSDTTSMLDLRGYGTVTDLNVAMSVDSTLKSMVADFSSGFSLASFADPATLDSDVTSILYQWAGVESVDPSSRGPNVNAQDLEFLEHIFGQNFSQWGNADPGHDAGGLVESSWQGIHDGFKADLLIQAGAGSLFDSPVSYDPVSGVISGDTHLSETGIENLATYAPGADGAAQAFWVSVADFIDNTEGISNLTTDEQSWLDSAVTGTTTVTWDDIVNAYDHSNPGLSINGTSGNDSLDGGTGNDSITGDGGNDTINGEAGNDIIVLGSTGNSVVHGGDGDDTITAYSGTNTLYGDAGSDTIYGGTGADTIDGGTGGNHLYGGSGNTTYIFGGGNDFIQDNGGTDQLLLPSGITSSDLTFMRVSSGGSTSTFDDLLITIDGGTGGSIQISSEFGSGSNQVETLVYSDSSTLDLTALASYTIYLDATGDSYSSGSNSDLVLDFGATGQSAYLSGTGDNTLIFGQGNHSVSGNSGDTTYVAGPGYNVISDNSGSDTITVPTGFTIDDLTLSRHIGTYGPDNDLIIDVRGLGEIQIENQFYSSTYAVEHIYFTDGSSTVALADQTIQTIGTTGNDYLYGLTSGIAGNWFDGRGGSDYFQGGTGNNTFVIEAGFSNDTLSIPYHTGNTNTLSFEGVDPSHIRMWTDYTGALHIQDTTDTSHSITVYAGIDATGSLIGSYLEQITFDDSGHTTWDLTSGLTLTGDNSGDALYGTAGADLITGGTGADYIYGYDGNDTIVSGGGSDYLVGGAGNDTYLFGSGFGSSIVSDNSGSASNVIHFAGIDPADIRLWTDYSGTLHLQDTTNPSYNISVYAGTTGVGNYESTVGTYFSQVTFDSSYSTTWNLTGGLHIAADNSGDSLYGTAYGDTITGGTGSDYIYGNRGDDTIISGGGSDYLVGGAGNDTYVFASGFGTGAVSDNADGSASNVIHFTGIDPAHIRMWTDYSGALHLQDTTNPSYSITAYAGTTGSGTYESTIGTYFSHITFDSSYGTTIDLTGGLPITGDNSGDNLYGTAQGDTITGGTGSDAIYGNGGNDVIYGGGGADYLLGGVGTDTFIFKAATALSASATLGDFSTSDGDKIDIADVISGYDPLTDAVSNFVELTTSGSSTLLKVDTDGSGTSFTQIATLSGVTGLNLSDLITDGNLVVHHA